MIMKNTTLKLSKEDTYKYLGILWMCDSNVDSYIDNNNYSNVDSIQYNTLKTLSIDDLKTSYRKMAMMYHPDKNSWDKVYEDKFKEINEAYNILRENWKIVEYYLNDDYNLWSDNIPYQNYSGNSNTDVKYSQSEVVLWFFWKVSYYFKNLLKYSLMTVLFMIFWSLSIWLFQVLWLGVWWTLGVISTLIQGILIIWSLLLSYNLSFNNNNNRIS